MTINNKLVSMLVFLLCMAGGSVFAADQKVKLNVPGIT